MFEAFDPGRFGHRTNLVQDAGIFSIRFKAGSCRLDIKDKRVFVKRVMRDVQQRVPLIHAGEIGQEQLLRKGCFKYRPVFFGHVGVASLQATAGYKNKKESIWAVRSFHKEVLLLVSVCIFEVLLNFTRVEKYVSV